jgi:cytochrome P450
MTTTATPSGAKGVPEFEYNYSASGPIQSHQFALDAFRGEHPFFWSTYDKGFWVLTQAESIRAAYQQPETFSSRAIVPFEPDPPYLQIPEQLDPPRHTVWRQLLAPRFGPAAVAAMEDKVRLRARELIEPLVGRNRIDFLNDFALQYPTSIFMELMGLPMEERDRFMHWEHEILQLSADIPEERERRIAAKKEVENYFMDLLDQRTIDPRDDLVSAALAWRIEGESIPREDLLSFCLFMFIAGLDTVTNQLAFMWWHFATHPDDRRRLLAEPELVSPAVEELLRYYSFVVPSRKVVKDTDHHGCPMKAGNMVFLPLCAANRDPDAFPQADQVILDRAKNNHVAFGIGPHRCLGSHLARRELRIALEEWHKLVPDYALPADYEITEHGMMFGIDNLELIVPGSSDPSIR